MLPFNNEALAGVLHPKSPSELLSSVHDTVGQIPNAAANLPGVNLLPTGGLLAGLSNMVFIHKLIHFLVRIQRFILTTGLKIWTTWRAVLTWPFRFAVNNRVTARILPYFVPYNAWWYMVRLFGTEEVLKRQGLLGRLKKDALDKLGDAGKDLLRDIHGNVVGRVTDRLDKIKNTGDAILDDIHTNVSGRAKDALDKIHGAGDVLIGNVSNIAEKTKENFGAIHNKTRENLDKIRNNAGESLGIMKQTLTTNTTEVLGKLDGAGDTVKQGVLDVNQKVAENSEKLLGGIAAGGNAVLGGIGGINKLVTDNNAHLLENLGEGGNPLLQGISDLNKTAGESNSKILDGIGAGGSSLLGGLGRLGKLGTDNTHTLFGGSGDGPADLDKHATELLNQTAETLTDHVPATDLPVLASWDPVSQTTAADDGAQQAVTHATEVLTAVNSTAAGGVTEGIPLPPHVDAMDGLGDALDKVNAAREEMLNDLDPAHITGQTTAALGNIQGAGDALLGGLGLGKSGKKGRGKAKPVGPPSVEN